VTCLPSIRAQTQTVTRLHQPLQPHGPCPLRNIRLPRRRNSKGKGIKSWVRTKKTKLIDRMNPHWHDLAADWEDLYKPVNRTPANPHQILHGLTATQDDVK
jgi:hypothetical protein